MSTNPYEQLARKEKVDKLVDAMAGKLRAVDAALLRVDEWKQIADALKIRPPSALTRLTVIARLGRHQKESQ